MSYPTIETERLILKLLNIDEAKLALDYFSRNKEHLGTTMPDRKPSFYELPYWENRIKKDKHEFVKGNSCHFFILPHGVDKVIGTINFTEIMRGVYQGCFLGYGIDKEYEGQGLMTESLSSAIKYAFMDLNIHKLLANYMPWNKASGRVLEKLGFYEVGLVKQELYLSGKWQDHIETRLINKNWKNTIT